MAAEFSIIKKFFQRATLDDTVIIGSGDDCAIVEIPSGYQLALSIDTLVLNTHFTEQTPPFDLGYKAVTSTISDLAAMGAEPKWLTGSLTMPQVNEIWLQNFSNGLFLALQEYQMTLIGGDLSRGPLSMTWQAHGILPASSAVTRSGAQISDLIYVTNTVGDAALGLRLPKGNAALNCPKAQIAAGLIMREFAHSCIDISDGLLQDLQHILTASDLAAKIYVDAIPLSPELQKLARKDALALALNGGEDYQLLIIIPKAKQLAFEEAMTEQITCIGEIIEGNKLQILNADGSDYKITLQGYQHF